MIQSKRSNKIKIKYLYYFIFYRGNVLFLCLYYVHLLKKIYRNLTDETILLLLQLLSIFCFCFQAKFYNEVY